MREYVPSSIAPGKASTPAVRTLVTEWFDQIARQLSCGVNGRAWIHCALWPYIRPRKIRLSNCTALVSRCSYRTGLLRLRTAQQYPTLMAILYPGDKVIVGRLVSPLGDTWCFFNAFGTKERVPLIPVTYSVWFFFR